MIDLSIIIPVYNVERYLAKCLDSILVGNAFTGQVICVNDGSTDGSGKILEEHAKKYQNVEVITQSNVGLSAARNAGLKIAKGEYVCFIDSDDYWEPNVLGVLMKQVEKERLDVLRFDYQNVNENYEVFEPNKASRYIDKGTNVLDGETYLNERMGYACYAVMYIMKRAIVPTFTEGIHFEDVDWLPRMMLRAKRVNATPTIVYDYLVRQGSITQTQGNREKIRRNVEDQMYIIGQYRDYFSTYPKCKWLRNMQSSMVVAVLTSVAREFNNERNAYTSRLREMKVFPLAIANQGKTYARRACVINMFGIGVYSLLMHLR